MQYNLETLGAIREALRDGAKVFIETKYRDFRHVAGGIKTAVNKIEMRETNRFGMQPCILTSRPSVFFRLTEGYLHSNGWTESKRVYAEI